MRKLLEFGRERQWSFETAWKWSYERVKWDHDTEKRRDWKEILGVSHDDPRPMPERQVRRGSQRMSVSLPTGARRQSAGWSPRLSQRVW